MDDFVNEAGLLVASANKLIMQLLAQQGVSGLVPSHGALLNLLFTHEELDMSELARGVGRDPSTVTTLVAKLVKAGYVETRPCPHDKRRTLVSLSAKGISLRPSFAKVSHELRRTQEQGLSHQELDTAYRVIRHMRSNFDCATGKEDKE